MGLHPRFRRTSTRRLPFVPAAVLLLIAAAPAAAQQATLDAIMRDTTLANGLHVVVVPNPTVPLVTMQVTIRNGAFTQLSEAEEGLPHILEHMLFRAYGGGFGTAASKLNAAYNGSTSDESVTYYLTLPSENLDGGVRLLADLMRAPKFNQRDLEPELDVVRGELQRSASNPEFMLSTVVNQRLWGDAFGRKHPIGNMVTISNAKAELLKQTYERFYVPNNSAVVFSGDVAADAAFASSARHFARWKRGDDPFASTVVAPIPALAAHQTVFVPLESNDITMLVRWQGPSVRQDPHATYAADLFSSIVNHSASEFQTRLVDSGLFQSVGMGYTTLAHTGPVSIHATTTAEQLVEASAALRAELDRFSEPGYVTPEMLAMAKKRLEVDWAMHMETPSGLASFVGDLWSVADLGYARGYIGAMQAVTAADIQQYVTKYLAGPRVTGLMASAATGNELGASLSTALAPWRD